MSTLTTRLEAFLREQQSPSDLAYRRLRRSAKNFIRTEVRHANDALQLYEYLFVVVLETESSIGAKLLRPRGGANDLVSVGELANRHGLAINFHLGRAEKGGMKITIEASRMKGRKDTITSTKHKELQDGVVRAIEAHIKAGLGELQEAR